MSISYTYDDLRRIMRGKKQFEERPFPGAPDVKLGIRVLSQDEVDSCFQITETKLKDQYKITDLSDLKKIPDRAYNNEVHKQLLLRALICIPSDAEIEEGNYRRFFPNVSAIGELTTDQLEGLIKYYNEIQAQYSPAVSLKDEKSIEEALEKIKKNSARGSFLNTYELETLLDFIIANPTILLKDNGSSSVQLKPKDGMQKKNLLPITEINQKELLPENNQLNIKRPPDQQVLPQPKSY